MQLHEFNAESDPSIVFLHGANAGGWMWNQVISFLPEFHCIAVDMPGHADSRDLPWTSPAEVATGVARAISSSAHDGCAHVVGLSLGGLVALHLLEQEAEGVLDLMISGVPARKMPYRWLSRIVGSLVTPFIHNAKLLKASARSARIPRQDIDGFVRQAQRNSSQAFRKITQQAVYFLPPEQALVSPT